MLQQDILSFEKKGIKFMFKNFYVNEYGELKASWKVPGHCENNRPGSDGYFFQAKYLKSKHAMRLQEKSLKIGDKYVTGVTLPDTIDMEKFFELARQKRAEEKRTKREKEEACIRSGEAKLALLYSGSYLKNVRFVYVLPKKENMYTYFCDDTKIENRKLADALREKKEQEGQPQKRLATQSMLYFVTEEEKNELLEKEEDIRQERTKKEKEKEKKEKERINALKEKAIETGEKQAIAQITMPCDNPKIECSVDLVVRYAMPDGSIQTERTHTY